MKRFILLITIVTTVLACTSNDDDMTPETSDSFDRKAMLINWADNIIIPSYSSFLTTTEDLFTKGQAFTEEPNQASLNTLRESYRASYISFQNVAVFEIGQAEAIRYRERINTYPVNTEEVTSLIAAGDYNFELPSTNDAQGFPALDYLLYGLGTDEETIAFFTNSDTSNVYGQYLTDLTSTINSLTQEVFENWTSGFRNTFVDNDGSSASASVDKLTNDFLFYYEKSLRAGKVGIPAGVFSNDPLPGNVEALYAQNLSRELAVEALNACIRFFNGRGFENAQTGLGYADYLDALNTIKNEEDLSTLINNQFTEARTKLNELDTNFVNQIQTNNGMMLTSYDELQRNVILLKVDMLQALSINIDYVDADGD